MKRGKVAVARLGVIGYLELEMFDEATQVLEEIEPEEKNRKEVLSDAHV